MYGVSTTASTGAAGVGALASTGVTGFWLLVTALAGIMLIMMGIRLLPKKEF
jgi:hypothetical protein